MTYEDCLKGAWMMAERNCKKCFHYKNFKLEENNGIY